MSAAREKRRVSLFAQEHPPIEAIAAAAKAAAAADCELLIGAEGGCDLAGVDTTGLIAVDAYPGDVGLCVALGGDGTILRALRHYANTDVPVFGINYGTVGFLAAAESEDLAAGLKRAFAGDFETVSLAGLEVGLNGGREIAVNDVSFIRRANERVAELSYTVGGREVGRVRCDGLVAATPAGSTGYNLANNGPILAWGVEGYVVSFIAPHTLTARALVVAPGDVLHVTNLNERDAVDVAVDGIGAGELGPGEEVVVGFRDGLALLAQLEGETFYRRIREKFGRLAH
jgi:NAD+ kinase